MATPCLICLRFVEYNTTAHKVILSLLLFLSGAFLNAVSPAATAEMQAAIPRIEKKRLGGLDNKSATQRIYSLQHMSRCTGFILGPVFGGFIEFRYDWKAMTIALGVLAGATAIPAFWLSGQDHKAKRAIRNDTVEEREPLLESSDLKSSFATFGEGSSRNITQVSSFHTNKSSLRRKPPSVPLGHRLITAAERPDLWHPTHSDPNNDLFVFPQWSQGAVLKRYYRQLGEIEELAHYQTMIVRNSDERVIATGVCTPFYWPELEEVSEASLQSNKMPQCASTLPDGGWETILARGVHQARARQGDSPSTETSPLTEDQKNDETVAWLRNKPNAMSGLLVVVAESHRGNRLATVLHENFKKLAHQNDLKALVLPVRPTHKNQYPYTPFEQYFAWIQEGPFRPGFTWPSSNKPEDPLPFDRGLRKHIRMGAKAIKPAVRSFTVVASAAEWQERLGDNLTLDTFTDENGELCVSGEKLDGFLLEDEDQPVPLKWDPVRQVGIYAETDMWMWHQL